ncbi:MAG: hypothetical protein LBE78_07135 [Burkholderiaceae bacterium]|jgi:hypothetical protein|nr:hypothetical protein [Burkholderiaceae bacterium]
MSVTLTTTQSKLGNKSSKSIPLATEEVFKRVWLLGSEQIGAQWLPLFESGIDIQKSDLSNVIKEMVSLRDWILSSPMKSEDKKSISSRIDNALDELKILLTDEMDNTHIFAG